VIPYQWEITDWELVKGVWFIELIYNSITKIKEKKGKKTPIKQSSIFIKRFQ